jgi:hypothetical protein
MMCAQCVLHSVCHWVERGDTGLSSNDSAKWHASAPNPAPLTASLTARVRPRLAPYPPLP